VEGLNDTGVVCMKADNPVRDDATMSAFRDVDGAIILLCTFTGGAVRLFVKQMLSVGLILISRSVIGSLKDGDTTCRF
jgi:hypothetical protein